MSQGYAVDGLSDLKGNRIQRHITGLRYSYESWHEEHVDGSSHQIAGVVENQSDNPRAVGKFRGVEQQIGGVVELVHLLELGAGVALENGSDVEEQGQLVADRRTDLHRIVGDAELRLHSTNRRLELTHVVGLHQTAGVAPVPRYSIIIVALLARGYSPVPADLLHAGLVNNVVIVIAFRALVT